ncbi:hypothetical protein HRW14_24495 [Streptomyces lunaelactis]|uniref:hypothetical protein n=1 Tax=Streptomyces lunaelactis TaxID=1535768 RepID=UPI0015855220|nr:hypothetical protein [Streptomyces lunaelactis]NUK53375.1 hypothetical protein [Streptomyces lunaelactis]
MSHTLQWNTNCFERTGRATSWTVTAYDAHGRQVYATLPLEYADPARYWHDYWSGKNFVQRVELAELTTDITERFIAFDDLPAAGQSTQTPELPDGAHHAGRHYRFTWGVKVLRTPDDVRRYYKWLADAQISPLPTSPRVDLDSLKLLEVTVIRYARPVELTDLPS